REPEVSSGWAPHVVGRGHGLTHRGGVCALREIARRLRPMSAERRRRQATNGSDYRSSARQRESGPAPSRAGAIPSSSAR
ncbi:MAG: hypothetical protein II150_03845, partial [Thermoguttaceae bacterium]|nr:hypothetical protein [Thermoguttaceae bacterium]